MTSTPSTILRLELIGTGDQAGTWGNTTNTNLGTLLEGAIAGLSNVSVTSANQALSAVNYATDESRMAMLVLTTTTTANFNVYAPPVSKQYTIYNNTAYTATFYNSTVTGNTTAAGTGVTIPAGKVMQLWTNGTNFAVQNSHIIGSVVGNVTGDLGGNLTAAAPTASTAAYGTNTTQVATTAFVQAALQALHPVGSIYINATNSTNPGTLLGFGTWVAFGAGRVPVGFDSSNALFDTAEETGGSANAIVVSHTHTGTTASGGSASGTLDSSFLSDFGNFTNASGIVSLSNSYSNRSQGTGGTGSYGLATINVPSHTHSFTTDSTGSSGTNANYQPYITVYMWKRTA